MAWYIDMGLEHFSSFGPSPAACDLIGPTSGYYDLC